MKWLLCILTLAFSLQPSAYSSEIIGEYFMTSVGAPQQLDCWIFFDGLTVLHTYQVEISRNLKTWSLPTCGGVMLARPFTCTDPSGTASTGFPIDIMPPSPSYRVFVDRNFFRLHDITPGP